MKAASHRRSRRSGHDSSERHGGNDRLDFQEHQEATIETVEARAALQTIGVMSIAKPSHYYYYLLKAVSYGYAP
jgi:hypothetical protein